MKTNKFLQLFLFIFLLGASGVSAELKLSPEMEQYFRNGLNELFNDKIEEALENFDSLIVVEPDNPFGYFCKAICYDFIMDEYRNLNFMDKFNEAAEKAIEKSKILEEKGNPTAETFLWSGGSHGIRGVRRAMMGKWWGGFRDGIAAAGKLENAVKMDSTLYDAYFGLGNYHYWKSIKSRVFWWLPFIEDERQKGIDEILISIKKGKFTDIPGKMSLMRVYIEEKDYNKVLEIAEDLINKYNFLQPLWFKSFSLIQIEEWQKGIESYNQVLKKLREKHFHGIEGELECFYFFALCNYKLGEIEKAKTYLEKILLYEGDVKTEIYFYENFIDSAKKLMKEIKKSE